MSATCKSCGARILWCVTPARKKIPVDAVPLLTGTLFLIPPKDGDGDYVAFDYRSGTAATIAAEAARAPRYNSHFATCQDAAAHRKKKR